MFVAWLPNFIGLSFDALDALVRGRQRCGSQRFYLVNIQWMPVGWLVPVPWSGFVSSGSERGGLTPRCWACPVLPPAAAAPRPANHPACHLLGPTNATAGAEGAVPGDC